MRVIILRPWADKRAFVVVVVLISNVPVDAVMKLDCQPRFRGLETHRIRSDQRPGSSGRIRHAITLTVVFVYTIGNEHRSPWHDLKHGINEEEVVSAEVQTVAERMTNVIEEVFDNGVAVNPMMVVARA